MFKIDQSSFYSWPVKIEIPSDGGKFENHSFDGHFKRLSQKRISEINKLAEAGELTDMDLAKEVLVGWKGIMDGEEPIPYSEEAKEKVLNVALVSLAIAKAFFESLSGAKRKN